MAHIGVRVTPGFLPCAPVEPAYQPVRSLQAIFISHSASSPDLLRLAVTSLRNNGIAHIVSCQILQPQAQLQEPHLVRPVAQP